MADYDPKSIPVLDDIIENKTEEEQPHTEASQAENNLELFSAEPVVTIESEETAETLLEPALIDYNASDESGDTDKNSNDDTNSTKSDADEDLTADTAAFNKNIELEPMVEDIVSNIMPELESQLRLMVKKALEDKF